jgi:asparagine synthase (glutamine-hydrolysing)
MCGIAGIVYPDVFQLTNLIIPMLDTLRHQKSVVRDSHTYKYFQLGSCGTKLATNEKKNIVAALSGSITNRIEIRDELKINGYRFHTDNPAEVIALAYEQWGPSFIQRVEGEFAIAILDQHKEKILLFRDRIGRKTMYWYHNQNTLIFATELKTMLITGIIPQTPAMDALSCYLLLGYTAQDMTPVKDVNKLLPGYYLSFDRNKAMQILPYWSYSACFEKKTSSGTSTIIKTLDGMLQKSVRDSLPEEGTVGCFLSGGLGSSSVAYYLNKTNARERLKAFSCGFKEENDFDIEASSEVARTLNIDHKIMYVTPENFLDEIVPICWYLDEPIADPTIQSTWRMAKAAARETSVVYSGMGSDELLAGHTRYSNLQRTPDYLHTAKQIPLSFIQNFLIPFFKYAYSPWAYSLLKQTKAPSIQYHYLKQNALFDERELKKASPKLYNLFNLEMFLQKFHHIIRIPSTISSLIYFDVKTRLPDQYILQYERMTGAFGLEWNTPFLEKYILEYLASIPEPEQLSVSETALYLKAILSPVFSEHIINRPKRTRKDFLRNWVESPELVAAFQKLSKGTLAESGLISEKWLRLNTSTPYYRGEKFRCLWAILMLEIWFRLFLNRSIQIDVPNMPLLDLLSEK